MPKIPRIMGILNLTPDSFSDGGCFVSPAAALAHARQMLADGASIIDIGAESTRPGAAPIDAETEWLRLEPVVSAVAQLIRETPDSTAQISIDTYRPSTARRAIEAGASIINDVRAGSWLEEGESTLHVAAETGASICLMHMQGNPSNMQQSPSYQDVVVEVAEYLTARRDAAIATGVPSQKILIDPGFGFGKLLEHNIQLMQRLSDLTQVAPVVLGLSRKSSLAKLTSTDDPERLPESLAGAIAGMLAGVAVVRVHDVAATRRALLAFKALASSWD